MSGGKVVPDCLRDIREERCAALERDDLTWFDNHLERKVDAGNVRVVNQTHMQVLIIRLLGFEVSKIVCVDG